MLTYPEIDPVALTIGPLKVHWYGLMYLVGFAAAWALGRLRAKQPGSLFTAEMVDDLLFYCALGVVAGGRLGYILFYNFGDVLNDPFRLLRIWEGGMSFHGGLLGVITGMYLFARRHQLGFFTISDFVAPLVTIGLFAGRIGNFINAELWGGPATIGLGMRVPCDRAPDLCQRVGSEAGWSLPVHASQLYEAALEGLLLFVILWLYSSRPRPTMAISGLFLLCYGLFRFAVEFVRMPDAHIGYLAFDWLTMGQVLSLPMILIGGLFMVWAYARQN